MAKTIGTGVQACLWGLLLLVLGVSPCAAGGILIDHNDTDIASIPLSAINKAKSDLHIAYGHTSHGSQITTSMTGLVAFANGGGKGMTHPTDTFAWNNGGTGGALDLADTPFSGASDLGAPDYTAWETATRNYLDTPANSDVNVIIWSWCGQVSTATEANINTYLSLMNGLETDYPNVFFVYMTGHLDGTALTGNLHLRNEQIRSYCATNNKILYDFADIESYNPDGTYFGDKLPDDCCDYDSDGALPRSVTGNWAVEWQNTHTEGVDWYDMATDPAHTKDLNGNLKAYAAWALWTEVAAIPEPSTVCLVGLGLGGLAALRRRRKR